ncbi:uncharacterized protein A4U43_C04F15040 [Asparagus officinalis]|uniref:DUF679 domain-containing protein n=1 Tax=Asparagus officinalis TaxID=4686 RepID=A0A5P1F0Z9_ASPOF|nr:uncharacterized protein LOC109837330 [Asparagus officinalis]ONK72038.1 uncharacterized protein A4U43_C04F15040 [Asparagus officinalis]
MSQRIPRSKSIKTPPPSLLYQETKKLIDPPAPPPTFSQKALTSTANLANLLPTGTLLAFQLLTPVSTNNGSCDAATRLITQILLLTLAVSAFIACFTDSFRAPDGQVYYGLATRSGMWLFNYPVKLAVPDLSEYRVSVVDGVHAVLTVLVFVSVAARGREEEEVLDLVPVGVGLMCGLLFVVFPTTRHGIGYPVTADGR